MPAVPVGFPDLEIGCEPGPVPAEVRVFPDRVDLAPGESTTIEVHVVRNGYCGPIEVEVTELPESVHSEITAWVSWPATVATVQLTASDALSDEISDFGVHSWTSRENWVYLPIRTRASAEPDWTENLVGIPDARGIWNPTWLDENRFYFSDYERTSPDGNVPIIRCIQPGTGHCTDFGVSGSMRLDPPRGGVAELAPAPDDSFVVAVATSDPAHSWWARLTSEGDLLPFPGIASAATDTRARNVVIDAQGRILFSTVPDGVETSSTLARLNPDGSLDESFGDGGAVPAFGMGVLRVLPDGRIVLKGFSRLLWLEDDGTPIGEPVPLPLGVWVSAALSDGSVIYGEFEESPPDGGETKGPGSVTLVDSNGVVIHRWDLGLYVKPLGFAVDGEKRLVIAQGYGGPHGYDSGHLMILDLPVDGEPMTIAEGIVGSNVWSARLIHSDPVVVVGTRRFQLPDGDASWDEAFVWRIE